MKAPARHSWPRNVRKLQDLIERSIILSTSAVLGGLLLELPARDRILKVVEDIHARHVVGWWISHILQTLQETKRVIGGRNGAAVWLSLEKGSGLYDRNTAANKRGLCLYFPSNHRWINYFPLWNAKALWMVWRLGNQENA